MEVLVADITVNDRQQFNINVNLYLAQKFTTYIHTM